MMKGVSLKNKILNDAIGLPTFNDLVGVGASRPKLLRRGV
jgi:hypothetical protein